MLDYRDISLMESVPLLWRTVTASPVGIEPMTIWKTSARASPTLSWKGALQMLHLATNIYPLDIRTCSVAKNTSKHADLLANTSKKLT